MGVYTHTDGNWVSRRGTFLILLILFHVLLLWALKSGFAIKFINDVVAPIKAEIINEPEPEEPPPPPPPVKTVEMPPVSVPPVLVDIQIPVEAPPIQVAVAPPQPPATTPPVHGTPPAPGPAVPSTKAVVRLRPEILDFYPTTSVSLQEEGRPVVKICWDVKGNVLTSAIDEPSGKKRLDDAAVKYGLKMKMKPGTTDGQAVTGCATQPVLFSLKDAR
ncbi:MAG: TonB family protein [Pseudomonadota bacterium]